MTFPVSAAGSAGMEAALSNALEPGDTAIIGVKGVFGTRLAEMVRRMGALVVSVEAQWGRTISADALLEAHAQHPDARLLALVHAETSTGVWRPLEEVGEALSDTETLFVVDAVTSLAGIPMEVDIWKIDVCYSGTVASARGARLHPEATRGFHARGLPRAVRIRASFHDASVLRGVDRSGRHLGGRDRRGGRQSSGVDRSP